MKLIRVGLPALAIVLAAAAGVCANAQNSDSAAPLAKQRPAPDPEQVSVSIMNRIPPVDRGNLKGYWSSVEERTKEQWMQILPVIAKPPMSTSGEVKIDCWLHTDGRVTGMMLKEPSGKTALDRAAWAAITGSTPYDAFPYGISVQQVRVRFTFGYNGGVGGNLLPNGKVGPVGVKPKVAN